MKLLRDLFRDYRFALAFVVLSLLVGFALLSFFSPYDPTVWGEVPRDMRPSAEYWLGTDSNGHDIFWIATFAVRNSLIIALIAGIVSRIIAVSIGMVAGYSRAGHCGRAVRHAKPERAARHRLPGQGEGHQTQDHRPQPARHGRDASRAARYPRHRQGQPRRCAGV